MFYANLSASVMPEVVTLDERSCDRDPWPFAKLPGVMLACSLYASDAVGTMFALVRMSDNPGIATLVIDPSASLRLILQPRVSIL